MKRLIDVLASLAALALLSPLLVLAAAAIMLDTGRPVIFSQQRVGRGGGTFRMFKFRSMVKNAETIGPNHTADDDSRITRTGRFLRRSSIDELPQLVNVLAGDMSLVGPRPDVPAQRTLYSESQWALRCSVRPGVTGLAQAELRSEATLGERIALDLQYAQAASVWLDLKIIAWTVLRLARSKAN
ncbi:MAG: sugar transferase [Ramlibacter sp.]